MHSLAVSVLLAVPLLCLAWSDGAGSCDRVGHGKKADGSGGCSLRAEHTAAGTTDGATHIVTLACPTDFRGFVLSCRATQQGGGSEAAASLRPMAGSPVKAMNMHVSKSCAELSLAGFGAVTHTSPAPKRSVSAQLTLDGHASSPLELAALVALTYDVWHEFNVTLQLQPHGGGALLPEDAQQPSGTESGGRGALEGLIAGGSGSPRRAPSPASATEL